MYVIACRRAHKTCLFRLIEPVFDTLAYPFNFKVQWTDYGSQLDFEFLVRVAIRSS